MTDESVDQKTEVFNLVAENVALTERSEESKKKFRRLKRSFPSKNHSLKGDNKDVDPFPAQVSVSEQSLSRHDTGAEKIEPKRMKTKFHQNKFAQKKKQFIARAEQTARAEILNHEDEGFLIGDNDELTYNIRQNEIASFVDIASATKHFNLILERFGPYRMDYTVNGRYLLIGGKKGHIAAFDWMTKKLLLENNVMESVRDVQWLHVETMFAVAQKRWTFIYDNMGVELHCLKMLHDIKRLEFLQRHFLLAAGSNTSFLHYVDVSIGKLVQSFRTHQGSLDVMCQNPNNAIIHTGHSNGTVQLWSPNVREPLVKMLAHSSGVRGIAIEDNYMATTGLDSKLRIWDVRKFKQLHAYSLPFGLSEVAFSQRHFIACAVGNSVQIFKDAHIGTVENPYLVNNCTGLISCLQFCPYEDVLGVGHQNGFTSLLVPGCGEANVDSLRANPFESKSQRREREVKQLLDKIQPELITLDTSEIVQVNTQALEEDNERLKKILYLHPRDVKFTPRNKRKGLSKEKRKQIVQAEMRFARNEEIKEAEEALLPSDDVEKTNSANKSVLDRFKRKK